MAKESSGSDKPKPSDKMAEGPVSLHKTLAMGKSYPGIGKAVAGDKK